MSTHQQQANAKRGRICIFFKSPEPGSVKTRLCPPLTPEEAAHLARAFFADTLELVSKLEWASVVVATTGPLPSDLKLPEGVACWDQGDGNLGQKLERILRRALEDAPFAIALGADSPGLPQAHLELAHRALTSHDAAIGPALDGGFYLLGLKTCPRGLFDGMTWSQETTGDQMLARCQEKNFRVGQCPSYFDVDTPADLERLRKLLKEAALEAPHTAGALSSIAI